MKRVSFKVAKAIKEVGYPQDSDIYYYDSYGNLNVYESYSTMCLHNGYRAPFYLDVWTWLWNEKNIQITPKRWTQPSCIGSTIEVCNCLLHEMYNLDKTGPEEAIIAAIDYLVDNDLIK